LKFTGLKFTVFLPLGSQEQDGGQHKADAQQHHVRIEAGTPPGAMCFGLRKGETMIRKLASGEYRLYSAKTDPKTGKRRNLGTFPTRKAAEKHEREVQYFKRH
jgi:hypothetical protein